MGRIGDQIAHFVAALVILLPLAIVPCLLSFAWAGFAIGVVREVGELGNPVTLATIRAAVTRWDSPLDLAFWTLGGVAVGFLG